VHDLRLLRENPQALREGVRRRGKLEEYTGSGGSLSLLEELEQQRRSIIGHVESRRAELNQLSKDVSRLKAAKEDAGAAIATARAKGEEIAQLEATLRDTEAELERRLLDIPNIPLPDVPEGGEESNRVVRTWGEPRSAAGVVPHWELGERLGILDLASASKISGSGFVVLRGAGARLTRALMSFMLDLHTGAHGYEEVWVPAVVTRQSMTGTGQLPKFEEDAYRVADEDLFLVPTAEVPVTNLFRDEVLEGARLPLRVTAYTPCFRREAGAAGKDTRGLIRVHQFDKVELVKVVAPESSPSELESLTRDAETVLQRLGLPYRVIVLAGGDLGFSSAKTYDLEVWAPGVGKWLEVSSCSTFTDFQARRANIRFRPSPGEKPRFVHTLNGSGLAFPRTIIAILEHYQRPDGTVTVPEALRPYLGADVLR